MMNTNQKDLLKAKIVTLRAEREARSALLPQIHAEGQAALLRLLPVALRDTGQSSVIAQFLLGLYNGERFPFNMVQLRRLDTVLHDDCLAVLRMDHNAVQDVHRYFEKGSRIFEQMARDWGLTSND